MFWKYTLFQMKVFFRKRKQWILGILILLIFPLFYLYYQNSEPTSTSKQKIEEKDLLLMTLDLLPGEVRSTEEGMKIYENLTQQLSIINMQIYYLKTEQGQEEDNYIADGLTLNQLRMELHEQGNPFIPEYFVIDREEIQKENDLLMYLDQHDLEIEDNPYVATQFLVSAFKLIVGPILFMIILLLGSDMVAFERNHQTMLKMLPISFMKKAMSKIGIQFTYILSLILLSLLAGGSYVITKEGMGNLKYPVIMYTSTGYEIIPISKYILYVLLALILIIFMVLFLALLIESFIKNEYGTVLIGIALFFIPEVFHLFDVNMKILFPLKYIDITSVLSGDLAEKYGLSSIDYWHSILSMIGFTIVILIGLFIKNKLSFKKHN